MINPLISIVIPSFNHDRFIKKAIESVINQTYKNWELVIVDNNSTDNTDDILKCFDLPNIKVLKINNGGIIALSRNMGIKHSNGEWVAFLDSDDEWFVNKLQTCIDQIEKDVDILFHDLKILKNAPSLFSKKIMKGRFYKKPVLLNLLLNGSKINNSSVVIRKNMLEQIGYISIEKKIVASEDFNTWLKIAKISNGFKYIPKVLGLYRMHDSGISRKDMSYSMREATLEFSKILTRDQLKKSNAHIRYAHCRYIFTNSIKSNITKQLLFCIKYGNFEIKSKSLYMLIILNLTKKFNF